ncbi:MAG: hypothetical protein ACP5K1_04440 [Candidatus Bathyarchaeia archaeon]
MSGEAVTDMSVYAGILHGEVSNSLFRRLIRAECAPLRRDLIGDGCFFSIGFQG